MEIDIERLREDLINYFGTAIGLFPIAVMNLCEVQTCSVERLIQIAINNNFDLNDYAVNSRTQKRK